METAQSLGARLDVDGRALLRHLGRRLVAVWRTDRPFLPTNWALKKVTY